MGKNGDEVTHVSLFFHSNPHNLIINYLNNEYITTYQSGKTQGDVGNSATWIGSLKPQKITTLVLNACNSGHLDYRDNLAETFLKKHNIKNVYGWDGSMKWTLWSGLPTLAHNQEYFRSWSKSRRNPKGLMKFYTDKDGKVIHELVKPSGRSLLYPKVWNIG